MSVYKLLWNSDHTVSSVAAQSGYKPPNPSGWRLAAPLAINNTLPVTSPPLRKVNKVKVNAKSPPTSPPRKFAAQSLTTSPTSVMDSRWQTMPPSATPSPYTFDHLLPTNLLIDKEEHGEAAVDFEPPPKLYKQPLQVGRTSYLIADERRDLLPSFLFEDDDELSVA